MEGEDCSSNVAAAMPMAATQAVAMEKIELSQGSEHVVKMLNSGTGGTMIFEPAVIKVSKGDTIHFKALKWIVSPFDTLITAGSKIIVPPVPELSILTTCSEP